MPSSVSTDAQTVSALRKETPWQHSLPVPVRELLAGGVAGGLSKTSVAPLERCKILFQTGKVQHGSVVRALTDIFRSEGFVGFFRGNGASVMRIVPYSALYMSSYERYRRLLVDVRFMAEYAEEGRTSPVVDLVAGSAAGASAVVVTYPLDLVHTRLAVMIESKPGNGAPGGVQGSRGGAAAGPAGTAAPSAAAGTGTVASLPFPSLRTVTAAGAAAEGAAGAAAEGAAAATAAAGVGGAAGGGSGGGRGGPVSTTPHQGPGPPGSKSFSSRPAVGGPGAQLMAVERGRTLVGRAGTSTHSSGVLPQGAQKGASAGPFVVQGVAPAGGLGTGPAAAAGARPGTRGIRTTVVAAAGHPRPTIAGVLLSTLRQEGVRGVYHGMGPSLYGILPYAGLKFYMYQALKGRFHSLFPERMTGAKNNRLPVPVMLAYGAVAGLVAQTLTYPLDVVRRRMQVEGMQQMAGSVPTHSPSYLLRSTPQALRCMVRREGVRSLYAGMSINYLKVVPSTAIAFTIYDYMKSHLDLSTNL